MRRTPGHTRRISCLRRLNFPSPPAIPRPMPLKLSRRQYAEMYGPTVGDSVRLADTDLFVQVERDLIAEGGGYGNEIKFGGGKVIRDGMGQSPTALDKDCLDLVITN